MRSQRMAHMQGDYMHNGRDMCLLESLVYDDFSSGGVHVQLDG